MIEFIDIKKEHLKDIVLIENACFSDPMSEKMLEDMFLSENYKYFIAYFEKVVGVLIINKVLDEVNIISVSVLPEFREKKIASKLLDKLLEYKKENYIAKIHLEVRQSNQSAIKLYEKFRFLEVGMRKNYYLNPTENALLFTLEEEN